MQFDCAVRHFVVKAHEGDVPGLFAGKADDIVLPVDVFGFQKTQPRIEAPKCQASLQKNAFMAHKSKFDPQFHQPVPRSSIGTRNAVGQIDMRQRKAINVEKMQLLSPPVAQPTPHGMKGKDMKQTKNILPSGFTLLEIMIVVAIIGMLAAIAIPNFIKSRATSQANTCIHNLRQIDAAVDELALEMHLTTGTAVTFPTDLTPYIKLNASSSIPPCPAGGTYAVAAVGTTPMCSLSTTVTPAHVLP